MATRKYWLKMVGAASDRLANNWMEAYPELLREVRSPWRPTGIRSDDILVYYAAGDKRLFAIARATENGDEVLESPKAGQERWPYVLHVQVRLAIPTIAQSPDWDGLGIAGSAVQQKSYIEITPHQYLLAWESIVARTKP